MAQPRKGVLRERSHVMILPASAPGAGPVNAVPGHGFGIVIPMWVRRVGTESFARVTSEGAAPPSRHVNPPNTLRRH